MYMRRPMKAHLQSVLPSSPSTHSRVHTYAHTNSVPEVVHLENREYLITYETS